MKRRAYSGRCYPSSKPTLVARILVVEDNADIAWALAQLLETSGHVVDIAADGYAALCKLDHALPDVAFIDIGLPGMDGIELARRTRQRYARRIRLVACTAYAADQLQSDAKLFDAYLLKPSSPAQIEDLLSGC
jgi:CheY-like chemotaxis protein